MNKQKNGAERRADAYHPTTRYEIKRKGPGPKHCTQTQQDEQSSPFKGPPSPGAHIRLTVTSGAYPAVPKTERQDRNPKDMDRVKRAYLDGALRFSARNAIVVAERCPFWTEMVDAMDYEHVITFVFIPKKTSFIIRGCSSSWRRIRAFRWCSLSDEEKYNSKSEQNRGPKTNRHEEERIFG